MKLYNYYVASFNVWTIVHADNAKEAMELGEQTAELKGKTILTVRVATREEMEMHLTHLAFLAGEFRIEPKIEQISSENGE